MEISKGEHHYQNEQNIDQTAPPSYSSVHQASSDSREFIPMPQPRGQPPPQHQNVVYHPVSPCVQQPQRTTVIVTGNPVMGPHPQMVHCPGCGESGESKIMYENRMSTHVCAFMLCFSGCCCFSPLPYYLNSCRNTNHYCQHCNGFLGTYLEYPNRRY